MTGTVPAVRPARPFFSSGPCAKRPGWTPEALKDACLSRSHRSKHGKAKLKEAIDRTRKVLGVPADYRIAHRRGLRHRRGGDGAVVAARAAAGRCARLGKLRRGLGHRRRQAAQAERHAHAQGGLRRAARSRQDRSFARHRLRVERHDLGRARAERRLDQRTTARASRSAMRPRRPSRWTCRGRSSMW